MANFIELSGIDSFSDDLNAVNTIYLRPNTIMHIELFSGPYPLSGYAPNGAIVASGRTKQIINGSILILSDHSRRIVAEHPSVVLEMVKDVEF